MTSETFDVVSVT